MLGNSVPVVISSVVFSPSCIRVAMIHARKKVHREQSLKSALETSAGTTEITAY